MKTQKELKQLITKQVEEINLSQQVELAVKNHYDAIKVMNEINSRIKDVKGFATKDPDRELQMLITKMEKAYNDIELYLEGQ